MRLPIAFQATESFDTSAEPVVFRVLIEANARSAFVKSVYSFKTDRITVPDVFECPAMARQSR
jgi:hypothetical protein